MHDRGRRPGRGRRRIGLIRHAGFARRLGCRCGLGHRRIGFRRGDDRFWRGRLDRGRRGRRVRRGADLVGGRRRVGGGRVRRNRSRRHGCVSGRTVAVRHGRRGNRILVGRRVLDGGDRLTHRKEAEGIDVAVLVVGPANAEVDRTLRPNRPDDASLGDVSRGPDVERAEVRERDGIAVWCAQAQCQPVSGCRSRVRDDAADGRENGPARIAADLDAAALAAGVRMAGIEGEGAQHRAVDGPRPGERARRHEEQRGNAREYKRPNRGPNAPRTSSSPTLTPTPTVQPHACLPHSLSIQLT
jgi:hypothetical protein